MKFFGITALLILLLFCCSGSSSTSAADQSQITDEYWDDFAHFLAGLPVKANSKFLETTKTEKYKKHVKYMDKFWNMMKSTALDKITEWQKNNLQSEKKSSCVFYPLSGADFLYLHSMFPNESYYLMVALEDPGNLKKLHNISPARCNEGLHHIRRVFYTLGYTYFTSLIMKEELNNYIVSGTTPVLLLFLARLGHDIVNVEAIGLNQDGMLGVPDEKGMIKGSKLKYNGMRIYFKKPGEDNIRNIVYLRMKISTENVSIKTPGGKFLNSFDSFKTMMKAAIYLMHFKKYWPVSDFLLKKSVMVVQDDSGIPYRSFDNNIWKIKLYGVYKPLEEVQGTHVFIQKDLEKSFKKDAMKLPFHYGYGAVRREDLKRSNLLVAEKKL